MKKAFGMKKAYFLAILLFSFCGFAQKISTDTIVNRKNVSIMNTRLCGDSLSSTFLIEILDEVAAHHHKFHSENVLVLAGEAEMSLGDSVFTIKKGDVIFISRNTWHSVKVKGKEPLRVISVQSPYFDGSDRHVRKK